MAPLFGSVADLETLQFGHTSLAYQYTFEGTYTAADGTGTWINQKVDDSGVNLAQNPFPTALTTQSSGFDMSSKMASFGGASSQGVAGSGLLASETINLGTTATVEFLVSFGNMTTPGYNPKERFLIEGANGTTNGRTTFGIVSQSCDAFSNMVGGPSQLNLIGGTSDVAYAQDTWYYVVQTFTVNAGQITINAWVADLTNDGELTQVLTDITKAFTGDISTTYMSLGRSAGAHTTTQRTAAVADLDALAFYDSVLDMDTINEHFNSITIPEAGSAALVLAFAALIPVLRRRRK